MGEDRWPRGRRHGETNSCGSWLLEDNKKIRIIEKQTNLRYSEVQDAFFHTHINIIKKKNLIVNYKLLIWFFSFINVTSDTFKGVARYFMLNLAGSTKVPFLVSDASKKWTDLMFQTSKTMLSSTFNPFNVSRVQLRIGQAPLKNYNDSPFKEDIWGEGVEETGKG